MKTLWKKNGECVVFLCFLAFLLGFFSSPIQVFAARQDSLLSVWQNKEHTDTVRLKALQSYIDGRWYNWNVDSLLRKTREMQKFAASTGSEYYYALSLEYAGCLLFNKAKYQPALKNLQKAFKLWNQLEDENKILNTGLWIGHTYTSLYDYAKALGLLNEILELAISINEQNTIATAYWYIGNVYYHQGKFNTAMDYFHRSAEIFKVQKNHHSIPYMKYMIAKVKGAQGYYHQAIDSCLQVLEVFEKDSNMSGLSYVYRYLGKLFGETGDYQNALLYTNKGIEINNKREEENIRGLYWLSRGKIHHNLGKYTLALKDFEKALNLFLSLHRMESVARTYEQIGILYLSIEEYQQSESYFNNCLSILDTMEYREYDADVLFNLGSLYYHKGDFIGALEYYNRSLKLNKALGRINKQADIYYQMGMVYKDQGYIEEASYFFDTCNSTTQITGDLRRQTELNLAISELNLRKGDLQAALKYSIDGYEKAQEMIGVLSLEQRAAVCLYLVYKSLGKNDKALKYYELSHELYGKLNTKQAFRQIQQIEFNRQRREDSLAFVQEHLQSELAYQKQIIQEKNTRNTFMIAGVAILLIATGLFHRMMYIRKTNKELEQKNNLIALEKERAEKSEQLKEQFFDNVSHEFRTPLTLIKGPLEGMLESTKEEKTKYKLEIIYRNARRLEGMIDELLDLSKLEFGKVGLRVSDENVVALSCDFLQSFESLSDIKNIRLVFRSERKNLRLWLDPDKFRKIMSNLLSNAFKYTEEGGEIRITISRRLLRNISAAFSIDPLISPEAETEGVLITVSDTGTGIPPDKLPHIFDRFYQADDAAQKHHAGTGIGLALVKELVELHHGFITVESEPGIGTTFSLFFPAGREHLSNEEIAVETDEVETVVNEAEIIPEWAIEKEIAGKLSNGDVQKRTLPLLLIVEDNPDMRSYIRSHLENDYTLLEAGNGEDGLQVAIDQVPDLVLCDVMMPKMDGHEMTEKLKNDQRTSHIPVIILTARAGVESRIEGLETGADAYITKPFNAHELQVRVRKLIEQREMLQEFYGSKLDSGMDMVPPENGVLSMDQQFLQKARDSVFNHMSDSHFDSSLFAEEMAMSRIQLHRKIKALTNKTTNEFIRTIRLNRAASLLKQQSGNVTQVAYDTGFSSLSWFAKVFRDQFGMAPSEYAKS